MPETVLRAKDNCHVRIHRNRIRDAAKSKPKAVATSPVSAFEMPKFEMPKFEMPKMEVPAAFREIAEKGVAQAKEQLREDEERRRRGDRRARRDLRHRLQGLLGYGLKLIETARANSNAAFDLFGELLTAKSLCRSGRALHRLSARSQFETVSAQTKELADHAQKVATETVEPIKESFTSAFNKAA